MVKKKLFKCFRIILSLCLLSSLCLGCLAACDKAENDDGSNAAEVLLRFNEEGQFKIIQMSDFHEWLGREKSIGIEFQKNLKPYLEDYVRGVIRAEKPDLVVLTGDNVFPLSWMDAISKTSEKTYAAIAELFESEGRYWTLTFGNHDTEGAANKDDYMAVLEKYPHFVGGREDGDHYKSFVFSREDEDGETDDRYGNFSIPIYSADGKKLAYNVFLLDSGAYNDVQHKPYRYILQEQADWYTSEMTRLKNDNGGSIVPSVMFTHIPVIEVQEAYLQGGERIGYYAGISPSNTRSVIFKTVLDNGDVKGFFFGHNHANSYTGFYTDGEKKVMVGVTPAAQASSYDATSGLMCCRRILLSSDGGLTTGILTTDGGLENNETISIN